MLQSQNCSLEIWHFNKYHIRPQDIRTLDMDLIQATFTSADRWENDFYEFLGD